VDDDDERVDLSAVDETLRQQIGEVMDSNARIMMLCRQKADKCFRIADKVDALADKYREIGSLYVLAGKEHAQMLADTLDAEYNINPEDLEDDEEEDE